MQYQFPLLISVLALRLYSSCAAYTNLSNSIPGALNATVHVSSNHSTSLGYNENVVTQIISTGSPTFPAASYIYVWLSLKRDMWEYQTSLWRAPAVKGLYTDPTFPHLAISWDIEGSSVRALRALRVGAASVYGIDKLLSQSQPDQRRLPPALIQTSPTAETIGGPWRVLLKAGNRDQFDITLESTTASNLTLDESLSSASTKINGSEPLPVPGQPDESSLAASFTDADIYIKIEKPWLPDSVPYIHFAKLVVEFLVKKVYDHPPSTKISDVYRSSTTPDVPTTLDVYRDDGLLLRVGLGVLKAERDVLFSDLEQVLRSLVAAEELKDDPQVFEGSATLKSKTGGMGAPFINIRLFRAWDRKDVDQAEVASPGNETGRQIVEYTQR